MRKFMWFSVGVGVLTLAGCASAPSATPAAPAVDVAAEEGKVRAAEEADQKSWAAKDENGILAFYADDATLMTPGMPAAKGKDAMRPILKAILADPNLKLEFSAQRVEVAKSGDVAFTQGTYQMTTTDGKTKKPVTDKGSYVTGYKRQADGSWKAVSDINTSEIAPNGN
jgi:uncharacterized protein (TIGR02246 family)